MHQKRLLTLPLIISLLALFLWPAAQGWASPAQPRSARPANVTAFDLIIAMNTLRVSNGLPALVEDPIVNAVAQSTAEIMAANQMSWHIGDVRGRIAAAGYGGGAQVWATENFAVGSHYTIDQIMLVWSDESHMIPAVNPAYCHVGAGVSKSSNGMTYYVLQAAYISGKACGEYKSPGGGSSSGGSGSSGGSTGGVSQLIVPVKVATADADGKIFHVVQSGQSLWSIAIAYKVTIRDIEIWNNLPKGSKIQIGQRLFIPGIGTEGYATPTPVGMILVSTPDLDGKIVHTVQSYQTLSTISEAYRVKIDRILTLNGIQVDWPLQIGQKLIINPGSATPSPTPRPLTPLEKLTPESDGNYYHVVQSGETLSWIAQLYEVRVNDLMVWNNLSESSIIHPDQKLLLIITPPVTVTPTLNPVTLTPTSTAPLPSATPTRSATTAAISPTPLANPASDRGNNILWVLSLGFTLGGLALLTLLARKKR